MRIGDNNIGDFPMPDVAQDFFTKPNVKQVSISDGVQTISGHNEHGVGYRFFIHEIYNDTKSKQLGYEKYDEIEMIEWLLDKNNKPVERVRLLAQDYPGLLRLNDEGEAIGGQYASAYNRFKEGRDAPGLSLERWGVPSTAQIKTFASLGVFTVEQLAMQDRQKMLTKFGGDSEFFRVFERSILHANAQNKEEELGDASNRIVALEQANKQMAIENEEIKKQMQALIKGSAEKQSVPKAKAKSKAKAKAKAADLVK